MAPRQEPDDGLRKAIEAAGGLRALARALNITHPAIMGWKRVPAERAIAIESITGVPRTILRPDVYPPKDYPQDKKAMRK